MAPGSAWRTPYLSGDEHLVLICDEGYSSSLAAESLQELGVDSGDVIGGFAAWLEAGLPVKPVSDPWQGLAGAGPPD